MAAGPGREAASSGARSSGECRRGQTGDAERGELQELPAIDGPAFGMAAQESEPLVRREGLHGPSVA